MKKIIILLPILLLWAGCSKDKLQPRFPDHVILKRTGQKVRDMEQFIEVNRSSGSPIKYDSLASYATDEVIMVLKSELMSDTLKTADEDGAIAFCVVAFGDYWRDHPHVKKSKIWKIIGIGFDEDAYRVMPEFSERFLKETKYYVEEIVNGSAEYVPGVRELDHEKDLRNFIEKVDDNNQWLMTFRQILFHYFRSYAENPKNKAKPKRDGWLMFGQLEIHYYNADGVMYFAWHQERNYYIYEGREILCLFLLSHRFVIFK